MASNSSSGGSSDGKAAAPAAASTASKPQSNSSMNKAHGGSDKFLLSHGLKPWNHEDVKEGRDIKNAYRDYDAQVAADEKRAGKNAAKKGAKKR